MHLPKLRERGRSGRSEHGAINFLFLAFIAAFTGMFLVLGVSLFKNAREAGDEATAIVLATPLSPDVLVASATGALAPATPAKIEAELEKLAKLATRNAGKSSNGAHVCAQFLTVNNSTGETTVETSHAIDNLGASCATVPPRELTSTVIANAQVSKNQYFVAAIFIDSERFFLASAASTKKGQNIDGEATETVYNQTNGNTGQGGLGQQGDQGGTQGNYNQMGNAPGAGGLNQMGGEGEGTGGTSIEPAEGSFQNPATSENGVTIGEI